MTMIRKGRIRIPAFCFLCAACWFTALSQVTIEVPSEQDFEPIDKEQYWINLGAGVALRECHAGLPLNVSASYRTNTHLFSTRFMYTKSGSLTTSFGSSLNCAPFEEELIKEIAFMYGYVEKDRWITGSISAGPGITFFRIEKDKTPLEKITSLSFAVEAQGLFTFSPRLGVGITAFANVNQHANLFGFLVGLQIGKLR